jgi:hypothetical protein
MGRIRQVLVITLGVGFLVAAGFTAAAWQSRRALDKATKPSRGFKN